MIKLHRNEGITDLAEKVEFQLKKLLPWLHLAFFRGQIKDKRSKLDLIAAKKMKFMSSQLNKKSKKKYYVKEAKKAVFSCVK